MADTYSHTFASAQLKNGSVTLSNVAWNFSMTGSTYFGWDATKGIQLGKKVEPATLITLSTSAIKGKIMNVVVNTSGASGVNTTLSVKVNGVSYTANTNTLTTTATDYAFAGAESGDIVITWNNSGKGLYIKSLKVEYENIVAGVPTISASDIDFGTILATNEAKTFTVVGSDLTENITATLKTGTAFELSGDLTKDGGDLTVKFIATAAGTYSDEITLTSGETTKTIVVSATYVVIEGEGTEENPYTCADVTILNNAKKGPYWVKGYILGCINNNALETSSFSQVSNLALGATADAKDYVPVQLIDNNVRTALNLVAHADLKGAEVMVYGELVSYYSKPGIKNTSNYKILAKSEGGDDEQVEATAIALNKTTASLEQYREELLVATLTPAEATTQIVWTSSNGEIATVTDGLVKAIAIGEATITAKAGEFTATCVVTVSEATVLTCAEAAEMALDATANDVKVEGGQYVVSGYVTSIVTEYSEQYKNISVWVADTKDGGELLQLFRAKLVDEVIPVVGDSVVAVGYLTKFKDTTPEMAAGCVCRVIVAPVTPVITIDATTATATITCETEGAVIKYAIIPVGEEVSDEKYQIYESAIELNKDADSYTIYAYAENDGLQSEVVSAEYKVKNGEVTVGVEVVDFVEIFVQNRTIVAEGEFQIFTITGQNVTNMNGNLENGVYVVRSANAVGKVVVK